METVEIVIYLTVALIVGFLMIGVIGGWDYGRLVESITESTDNRVEFESVDHLEFVGRTIQFWDSCGFGAVDKTVSLYIEDTGSMTKTDFFQNVKKLNMCNSLQSLAETCGTQEHITGTFPITFPRVVRLSCDSTTRTLSIS